MCNEFLQSRTLAVPGESRVTPPFIWRLIGIAMIPPMMKRCSRLLLLALGAAVLSPAALANDDDPMQARRALEAGKIVSLEKILAAAEAAYEGQIVEVELELENDRWEYEIELLTREGNLIELKYDAATARLLSAQGKGVDAARRKP